MEVASELVGVQEKFAHKPSNMPIMVTTSGEGSFKPKSPLTASSSSSGIIGGDHAKPTLAYGHLNVRETFEKSGLDQAKEISKRVNLEIERKREDLRSLVGERYRDLIDAADTIGLMSTSSSMISQKLECLRSHMISIPSQLSTVVCQSTEQSKLNRTDLLQASHELKLFLDTHRVVQNHLSEGQLISATHLSMLYSRNSFQRQTCSSEWKDTISLIGNACTDSSKRQLSISKAVLSACNEMMDNPCTPPLKLAECIASKQVLAEASCAQVVSEFLRQHIQSSYRALHATPTSAQEFYGRIGDILHVVYLIFIDSHSYATAVNELRSPKISMRSFGLKFMAETVKSFNEEFISVEDSPTKAQLAQMILSSYIEPLKSLTHQAVDRKLLMNEETFKDLHDSQKLATKILAEKTANLARGLFGNSDFVWTEVFYPLFRQKSEEIALRKIKVIFDLVESETFPMHQRLDQEFDLVSYIWKNFPTKMPENHAALNSIKDVDLKLKCVSSHIANLCLNLEENFTKFFVDFQALGNSTLRTFISQKLKEACVAFIESRMRESSSLFLGRFAVAMQYLCHTLWKLIETKDAAELRAVCNQVSEECWSQWSVGVVEKFRSNISSGIKNLKAAVAVVMPVTEEYVPEGEGAVKPSVRVPLQVSHFLHSSLFQLCNELASVGPQSIPANVRETMRHSIGSIVISLYTEASHEAENHISPQTAIQLIFDIKFCQWFHLQLKEEADPLTKYLQSVVDPFDLEIVTASLNTNLKRFLFETHLTLGLLLSEESHTFIAQNFKTKVNISFPSMNPYITSSLPLLPV